MTTTGKITNPQRLQDWQTVFGTDEVQIISPFPHLAHLPGHDQPQLVYMADLTKLTADQRQRLIAHIAVRFGVPVDIVARDLDRVGLPILADDVTVVSDNLGLLLSAMDDAGDDANAWRELTAADLEEDDDDQE